MPDGTRIDFMKARFAGLGLSALLVLGSVLLLFKPGLNFGIDFRGGIQMEVAASTPDDLSRYRAQLDGLGLGQVSLQTVGNEGRLLVRPRAAARVTARGIGGCISRCCLKTPGRAGPGCFVLLRGAEAAWHRLSDTQDHLHGRGQRTAS